MSEPVLTIPTDKVCYIAIKAREFDAKDVETDPDPASNPSDDSMLAVLESHADDPTYQELQEFIDGLTEDEQIDLVAITWLGRGRRRGGRLGGASQGGAAVAQQPHGRIPACKTDATRSPDRRPVGTRMLLRRFGEGTSMSGRRTR